MSDAKFTDLEDAVSSYFEYFEKEHHHPTMYRGKAYRPSKYSKADLQKSWPKMDLETWAPDVLHYLMNQLWPEPDSLILGGSVFDREWEKYHLSRGYLPFSYTDEKLHEMYWCVNLTSGNVIHMLDDGTETGHAKDYVCLADFFRDLKYWKDRPVEITGIYNVSEMIDLNDSSKLLIGIASIRAGDIERLRAIIEAGLHNVDSSRYSVLLRLLMPSINDKKEISPQIIELLCANNGLKFRQRDKPISSLANSRWTGLLEKLVEFGAFENCPAILSAIHSKAKLISKMEKQ